MQFLYVLLPANIQLIYDLIEDTINFQIIPKETLYDTLIVTPFELEEASELDDDETSETTYGFSLEKSEGEDNEE